MSAREGCPAWCTEHDDEYGQHVSTYRYPDAGGPRVGVALRQGLLLEHATLYVEGLPVTVTPDRFNVERIAHLMQRVGREDVAAAIGELAAMVTYPAAPVPADVVIP